MLTSIYFNKKNSYLDFNLVLDRPPVIPTSNEEVEFIPRSGVSGTLTIKTGVYKDKVIPIYFKFHPDTNKKEIWRKIDNIEQWLKEVNDNRFWFSFKDDKCYRVKVVQWGDILKEHKRWGSFEVKFICEPFLTNIKEYPQEITSNNHELIYSGSMPGEVNMKILAAGNIQVSINGETIQVENIKDFVEIDSKKKSCLNKDKSSKELDCTGNYPVLTKGENIISWNGDVKSITLDPRTSYK